MSEVVINWENRVSLNAPSHDSSRINAKYSTKHNTRVFFFRLMIKTYEVNSDIKFLKL